MTSQTAGVVIGHPVIQFLFQQWFKLFNVGEDVGDDVSHFVVESKHRISISESVQSMRIRGYDLVKLIFGKNGHVVFDEDFRQPFFP